MAIKYGHEWEGNGVMPDESHLSADELRALVQHYSIDRFDVEI